MLRRALPRLIASPFASLSLPTKSTLAPVDLLKSYNMPARTRHTSAATLSSTTKDTKADIIPAKSACVPRKSSRTRATVTPASIDVQDAPPQSVTRAPQRKRKAKQPEENLELDIEKQEKPRKKTKSKANQGETHIETRVNVHGEEYQIEVDEEGDPVRRNKNGRRLPKRIKEDIVYEIPDVPQRDFRFEGPLEKREERKHGFRGELGYACLNTVLRWQDPPIFSSRTARIKTMDEQGPDYIKELGRLNARDMVPMILWNEENGIRFMRLSSEVFPFASHEKYGYSLKYAEKELKAAGDLAKRLGHRLTMHPGQFTQLGSPRPEVIEASIRDLDVHCEMLDLMGLGPDSVMIIHGGGVFGDREATVERIKQVYTTRLSDRVKARLVLENDEMAYSADELLPICKELDIPLVFDFHHDLLRPSARPPSELLPEIQEIWHRRGITPKYHLSEPRPGATNLRERRAHSDRCAILPADLPADAHLMIEAKDKEQAVLELYRIYNLRPVKKESLRPPAKDVGVKTSGRKGKLGGEHLPRNSRKKSAKKVEVDDSSPSKEEGISKPKGKRQSKAQQTIEKAKALAKKQGRDYRGPGADEDVKPALDDDGYVKSSLDVLEDMHREAEWVRAELRAGRERRVYSEDEAAVPT